MVEFSQKFGCHIWTCPWGHIGFDFESAQEALDDFRKHNCDRSM